MGFFNSNKNRMASVAVSRRGNMRSPQSQNRRIIKQMMYDNKTKTNKLVSQEVYITKKQAEALDIGFTAYALKYGDLMIVGDIHDMLPEYQYDIHPDVHNLVRNNIFEGIKADKIGLLYAPKFKKFIYIALNDDYTISILFKGDKLTDLPFNDRFDIDNLHPSMQIIENINRVLVSVYYHSEVLDLCSNPIIHRKITEVFKR